MAFEGFPARARYTPLPDPLFAELLPQIADPAELRVTLYLCWLLQRRRGYPKFATLRELLVDQTVLAGLSAPGRTPEEELRRGLALAVARKTLLHLAVERDGRADEVYLVNTESSRRAVARIEAGELPFGRVRPMEPPAPSEVRSNAFVLYEQNIGLLTPLVAEQIAEAETLYPAGWIEDAFREATSLNRRSWRYVARILERWAAEGRSHGANRRHPQADRDFDKYFQGPYGHVVRR